MSKDNNVVYVDSPLELPWAFIPFDTIEGARAKYPNDTLYVYAGRPEGWKIVTVPVAWEKPKEDEDAE